MRWNEMLGGLGLAAAAVAFSQACTVTTTNDDGVTATNRATGEIRDFDSTEDVPDGWVACDDSDCPDPYACDDVDEAACLVRADCAPIYEESGTFSGCVEGGVETCSQEACGEVPPGMPAIICWDGSVGGSTGRCIEQDNGGCGWEIRECPPEPADCQPDDCTDPMPGMPNWECDDGTIGGPACIPAEDGTCGWAILECAEDGTCDDAEKCGPALGMPAIVCDDGSVGGNTGKCLDNGDGTCSWEIPGVPGRRIRTSSILRALVVLPITAACSTATPEPVAPAAAPQTPSASIAIAPAEWATDDSVAVDVHGAMVRGFEGARVDVVDPRPEMERRGEACAADPDCADGVSRDLGAAKVVRTKLATLGGTVLVRIGVVDLGSGTRDEERQEVVNAATPERIGATISVIAKEIAAPYRPPPPAPPPPPKQAAWYEQWWVWTLVGAAVVGTGVGVGAAVLTRDEGPDVIVTPP